MHHTTVLLKEAIDALIIDADGFYVDGTFGRGGHSSRLLDKLSRNGSVLARLIRILLLLPLAIII